MIEIVLEVLLAMIPVTAGAGIYVAATGDKDVSARPKAPPPAPLEDTGFDPFLAALESQVRENARLYAAVPSASWLAPDEIDARFAPAPVAEPPRYAPGSVYDYMLTAEEFEATYRLNPKPTMRIATPVVPPPPCPGCGRRSNAEINVTAEHNGEPSMWGCQRCNTEYTKRGETKASKKRQKAARAAAEAEAKRLADLVLPCGCSGDVRTRSYPSGGWDMGRYAECKTCGGCWDYAPKYDETGNPRKMHPRSGPVDWPNGNHLNDLPLPPKT